MPVRILKLTTFGRRRWRMGVDKVQAGRMTGTNTKDVRVGQGDVSLGPYIRNMGSTRPLVLPILSRMPENPVPMSRGNGARIMNIFVEGGRFISLQTHFSGSAVAAILEFAASKSLLADQAALVF
jgi:hypothetical protein